jgi:hypothetical protein
MAPADTAAAISNSNGSNSSATHRQQLAVSIGVNLLLFRRRSQLLQHKASAATDNGSCM